MSNSELRTEIRGVVASALALLQAFDGATITESELAVIRRCILNAEDKLGLDYRTARKKHMDVAERLVAELTIREIMQ